jgi:hypothetical protein
VLMCVDVDFFRKDRYLKDINIAGAYDARKNPFTANPIPVSQP